jgi:hypothetical protein
MFSPDQLSAANLTGSGHDDEVGAWRVWISVVVFAVAMAWLEAATVYYLRVLVDRVEPYQPNPLPISGIVGSVELVREAATLVMLLAVGAIAGKNWRTRAGYALVAFGVWDVFYYVFLRMVSGWPRSLFDWDVLFLLPLPWWGPVLAPVCIALMMIVWGTLVTQFRARSTPVPIAVWWSGALGITIALYVFMADALRAVAGGPERVAQVLPQSFNWPLFAAALMLMGVALPVGRPLRRRSRSH